MLKNPKAKGRKGEYSVRDMLRGYGYKAERTPLSGGIDGWKGDITSKDFPLFIEVKNTAKTTFSQWYEKASDQCGSKPPMIAWIHKGNIFSFLLMSDLISLIKTGEVEREQLPKQTKKVKLDPEDTAWQGKFSKFSMGHKNMK